MKKNKTLKKVEKLDYSSDFKIYLISFLVLGPVFFMLSVEFICICLLLFSYFNEEDILPKGVSFTFEDAKKVIQSNPFFKQDDNIEDIELYNCPAHTKGVDFIEKEEIIKGRYKNKEFLMSALTRLYSHQKEKKAFPFITFAIKGKYKTKGDFLINAKSIINPSVGKTQKILIPNDYGFLVCSDKKPFSLQKIEKILSALSIIKGKYPDLSFTLLIRKNIISFTLLSAKNFQHENLNVFFELFNALDPLQSTFPSLLTNQKYQKSKKIHLTVLKILVGIFLAIMMLGIIAACMEIKGFWILVMFLFGIPAALVLVNERIMSKKD